MTDTLPLVIGMVITFVLVRWIFRTFRVRWCVVINESPVDNREGEGGARTLPREVLDQLSTMFPNIPPAILRAEYIRAGSVSGAIENLLAISSNYLTHPQEAERNNSPPTTTSSPRTTVNDVLKDIDANSSPSPLQVDSATWSKDRSVRERLLVQRKQEMLLKARKY